jgi:hypothetical protein
MPEAADEIVVPGFPVRIVGKSFKAPIAATLPVASAKRHAASTFGPIDPAGKLYSRIAFGLAFRNALAVGFPNRHGGVLWGKGSTNRFGRVDTKKTSAFIRID